MAAPSDNSTAKNSKNLLPHTGEGVVIDLGTGDGRFVYQAALRNPAKFYIGIDANAASLKKLSMKATRKPAKGGLPNVLFLQAAIEDLPEELYGVADEIHIHFPWGSLLGTLLRGEKSVLEALRKLCVPECLLELVFGIDPEKDATEIERLGLPDVSLDYLQNEIAPKYEAAGFAITECGKLSADEWPKIETSWARKLQGNTSREVFFMTIRAG